MAAVYILYGYCIAGIVFAVWFSFFKVAKVDEVATGSSVWFKLIIIPATILLWPLVLVRLNFKNIDNG